VLARRGTSAVRRAVECAVVNTNESTCALCDQPIESGAASHTVRGKSICEACRRLVLSVEPRLVLPYADGGRRRRRWLLPAAGAMCAALLLALIVFFFARQAAIRRAQEQQIRALVAEEQAVLAARQSVLAGAQAQRPATGPVE
jgi:hypothetical protein